MTLFQRTSKMTTMREEQKAKKSAKQEHIQAILQERELRKLEERQRWTRREEQDFYRTLISFGVEQDADTAEYQWDQFKKLAKLESKFDHTLTDYYMALLAMCKRICKKPLSAAEESLSFIPEALSDERANKVLQRVDFMARIRACLRHPKLKERIQMCKKTPDLPAWWIAGLHDLYLLKGIAKHGLNKSEETIVHDPEFGFLEIWREFQKDAAAATGSSGPRTMTRAAARISNLTDDKNEKSSTTTEEGKKEENSEKGIIHKLRSQARSYVVNSVVKLVNM